MWGNQSPTYCLTTIQDSKGNKLPFYGYGDKPGEARYELSERLFEYDIKPNIDNRYVNWNDLPEEVKHKITVRGRKYKTELMGEWLTDYEVHIQCNIDS